MAEDQKVEYISIKDLVLWTENPRDPISASAADQDVVNRALEDKEKRWDLHKLAKEMEERYDFSELPTVVYHDEIPVVYDANRRVILGKIKLGLVNVDGRKQFNIPEFPEKIPCNICKKEIALKNILRKHGNSGSWKPLERDIFLHKHMHEKKSAFLVLEDSTKLISSNPDLNKRFVKEEVLNEESLIKLGFETSSGHLKTRHTKKQAEAILLDLCDKVVNTQITTRKNRGRVLEVLTPFSRKIIDQNKHKRIHGAGLTFKPSGNGKLRQSARTAKTKEELFGGKLYLKKSDTNNLYKDIMDLYEFYLKHQAVLSKNFVALIRMSLRLISETAAADCKCKTWDAYLKTNFEAAKQLLTKDHRTTLANYNVRDTSIVQLLNTGAHQYKASANLEQTMAVSIIIGAILTVTLGKKSGAEENT